MMTQFTKRFRVAPRHLVLALVTSVFAGGVMMMPGADAATGNGWTTTKVAKGGSSGAYCAISRQMDETTVTVGRTLNGQSSLALEMKNAKLDPTRVYRLSLKPGNADRIEIEAKPLNARTFVLNLDQVVDLRSSFLASPTLQVRYDDISMALSLANWGSAVKDMDSCLSSLSSDEPVVATKAKPDKKDGVVREENVEPTAPPVVTSASSGGNDRAAEELRKANEELATLRASRAADREANEVDKKSQQDQAMRLSTLEAENENLRASLRAQELAKGKTVDAQDDLTKIRTEFDKQKNVYETTIAQLRNENAALTKQNEMQKSSVVTADVDKNATDKVAVELAKLKTDYIAVVAEKNLLQSKVDEMTAKSGFAKGADQKLTSLQADLNKANAETDRLRSRVNELSAKPKGPDLEMLQQRLEALTTENVRLRADLASATQPETEMKVAVAAEAPLRQQMRDLRMENDSLRERTAELTRILDANQKGTESELIKASSKNWDLEQATRRLQESEREVQRLSLSMRDSKSQCEAEKKEIEYMLFDPKLAKAGQIALLNSLEDQIATLKSGKGTMPTQSAMVASAPVSTPTSAQAVAAISEVVPEPPVVRTETLAAEGVALPEASSPASIAGLLKQAGIGMTRAVAPVAKNPFGAGKAWSWETDTLAGFAAQQTGAKPAAFDGTVKSQIKNLKSKCKGDFAATPAVEQSNNGLHYAAYDAACIAGVNSTSAALLFYQKDGQFNVISHEAAPDAMADAMDARDRLITTIAGK